MGKRSTPLRFVCRSCGAERETLNTGNKGIYCDKKCRADFDRKGISRPSRYRQNGYWMLRWNDGGRYVHKLEHIKIWEDANGPKPYGFDIHHRDEDKGNNSISNLQLMPAGDHRRLHKTKYGSREERLADEARRARERRAAKRKMAG